jgi:hypothetical protein
MDSPEALGAGDKGYYIACPVGSEAELDAQNGQQRTGGHCHEEVSSFFVVVAVMMVLAFPANAPASSAPERHPEIREAIGALRNAKAHLQSAAHDFGGQRAEAIRATDEAIHQLEACMQYDRE